MKGRFLALIGLACAVVVFALPRPTGAQVSPPADPSGLIFVENAGQFADGARFQLRGGPGTVWLADDAIWITLLEPATETRMDDLIGSRYLLPDPAALPDAADDTPRRGVNIRLSFVGANPAPALEPYEPLTTTVSYFLGNDPEKWRPAVPVWGGVRYAGLYPGLDLELAGRDGELALAMVCRAADCDAALEQVALRVEGVDEIAVKDEGLYIVTAVGEVRLPLLEVVDAAGRPVETGELEPAAAGATVRHPFAPVPSPQALDPSPEAPDDDPADLLYSSFLGGSDSDLSTGIALDGEGNAYVTGWTASADFPTTAGAFDDTHNGSLDIFVARLSADGSDLSYASFIGGSDWDGGMSIGIDGTGSAYVAGSTDSWNFPATLDAFDTTYNSNSDAFVLRISPTGDELIFATFLGGTYGDRAMALSLDDDGNSYVAGNTSSADYPTTTGAYDETFNGSADAFVAVLDPNGTELTYSTFLGGTGGDYFYGGLVLDGAGNAILAGDTTSVNFPTTPGAFDPTLDGYSDAFVVKLNLDNSELGFATYLGGDNWDVATSLAVDAMGSVFVTGATGSTDFPTTPGAFAPALSGSYDGFVANLNPAGSELSYGTFLGGSLEDAGWAIMVDGSGNAYLAGDTNSADFPTTAGAFDTSYNGDDAFIAVLNPAGSDLSYATFLGGSNWDGGSGLSVDDAGNVYVAGTTSSTDFPTTAGAFDTTFNGLDDVFVSKLAARLLYADFGGLPRSGISPLSVTFANLSGGEFDSCAWDFGDGNSMVTCDSVEHLYETAGTYTVTLTISGTYGTDTETRPDYIAVYEPVAAGFAAEPTSGVAPLLVSFDNQSIGSFDACLWDYGDGLGSTECDDPTHEYGAAGVYTVSLTVSGPGGSDTQIQPDLVTVYEPATADFAAEPMAGVAPLEVAFANLSAGDFDTCLWDFGDGGTIAQCLNPTHEYAAAGVYTVTLTVSGLGGTDTLIKPNLIIVYEPVTADFSATPTTGIAPLLVSFDNESVGDYNLCFWEFGDGATSMDCADPQHAYAAGGVYTVTLEVVGLGGSDLEVKPGYITVYEPVAADFAAEPTAGPAPLSVAFTNLSTGDFDSCLWEFGDGGTSEACGEAKHLYVAPGVYTVTLTVSGPGGTDTLVREGYITVTAAAVYRLYLPVAMRP